METLSPVLVVVVGVVDLSLSRPSSRFRGELKCSLDFESLCCLQTCRLKFMFVPGAATHSGAC